MSLFPIDAWCSSRQQMVQSINSLTSNATFDGVPVLAIAVFRVCPDIEVIRALLNNGANPHAVYLGAPIIQHVFGGGFPEWLTDVFLPFREEKMLSDAISIVKPAVRVRPL